VQTINAEVEDIVKTIWSTLVGLPIELDGEELQPDASTMTSIVHIDGAWHGAVMLQCPMTLATLLAAAMFQGESEASLEDIGDALGELTNMVAGNIKALLPEPCAISLPTIARGSNYAVNVVGTRAVARSRFTCGGETIVVAVVQRSTDVESVT
jgi:CheY-specific phosphatase CheX